MLYVLVTLVTTLITYLTKYHDYKATVKSHNCIQSVQIVLIMLTSMPNVCLLCWNDFVTLLRLNLCGLSLHDYLYS